MLECGLSLSDIREMDGDEIELWTEAIDARDEYKFQEAMSFENTKRRYDKTMSDSRRNAIRSSEYRWHDKLRIPVDLRKLRR